MDFDLPAAELQPVGGEVEELVEHRPSAAHPKIDHEAIPKAMVLFHLILQVGSLEVLGKHGQEAPAGVVGRSLVGVAEHNLLAEAMLVMIQQVVGSG